MGISGTWAARQENLYSGARKWGTGVNPVHAHRDQTGRNIAPDGNDETVPSDITEYCVDYGFTDEEISNELWGYGPDTGTSDRPPLDTETNRATVGLYPPPGNYRAGRPGGATIRAKNHGADATVTAKTTQPDALAGFVNKPLSDVIEDAEPSDPSQYEMQTSMTQMRKDRTGSQRGAGSDSQYAALVPGRRATMAQRSYVAADAYRHAEMMPKQQDTILRPWRFRQVATGNPALMEPNAMYVSQPLQRVPNPDPYAGETIPAVDLPGFTDEGFYGGAY